MNVPGVGTIKQDGRSMKTQINYIRKRARAHIRRKSASKQSKNLASFAYSDTTNALLALKQGGYDDAYEIMQEAAFHLIEAERVEESRKS